MSHSIITTSKVLLKSFNPCLANPVRTSTFKCKPTESKKPPPKSQTCAEMHKPLGDKKYAPVTHVMFNLDGVLINSERLIMQAHTKYLAKFKRQYTLDLRMKVQGRREIEASQLIVKELMLPIGPRVYSHGVRQLLREYMPHARMMKGIRDLVCHLSFNKILIALNSSSTARTFAWKIQDRDLKDIIHRFCHITLGDEVKVGKPDPEMYNLSLKKFDHQPQKRINVLAIEDSEAGVLAAKAAGFQTVMIPDYHTPKSITDHADLVIKDFSKLELDEFSIPPITNGTFY